MAEMSDTLGWKRELAQFQEVLSSTKGQAVVIVGPAGSGKSSLLQIMMSYAQKISVFLCDCNIYSVGPRDKPNVILRGIGKWPKGVVVPLGTEQFLERLSRSVKEYGELHRRVIGVDPSTAMPLEFEKHWLEIIPRLPEKVKFIFTQRPGGILASNKEFMSLPNVVRIPVGKLELSEPTVEHGPEWIKRVEHGLRDEFFVYLRKKDWPNEAIDWQGDDPSHTFDLILRAPNTKRTLALVEFKHHNAVSTIGKTCKKMRDTIVHQSTEGIKGYVVYSSQPEGVFEICGVSEAGKPVEMKVDDFPHFKELSPVGIEEPGRSEEEVGHESRKAEGGISRDELLRIINEAGRKGKTELNLSNMGINELPKEIGRLSSLQAISVAFNQLTEVPKEIMNLSNLQGLDLSRNQLRNIPKEIGKLSTLRMLDLCENQLTEVPKEIGGLSSLEQLILHDNQLTEVPREIGELSSLQRLDLRNNQLTEVPTKIGRLLSLQLLSLENNQLTEVPKSITDLPHLSVIALKGNDIPEEEVKRIVQKLKGRQGAPKGEEEEAKQVPEAKAQPRTVSVARSGVGDGETRHDRLGFRPYVQIVGSFLTDERTELPVTLSVEGEWGSGKSSFMLQLEDEIRKVYQERESKDEPLIVKFKPWRHDKDEALWAAFALEFVRQISKKLGFVRRIWANLTLKYRRFDWQEGWASFAKVIGLVVIWLVVTGVLITLVYRGVQLDKEEDIVLPGWLGSIVVIAAALFTVLGRVKAFLGSPLEVDLRSYMKTPDYVSKVSFIEKFHSDFKDVIHSYVGDDRVYVFIDDLDRCAIPKAAELMESINHMISDAPNLVFVMGMDREKVAAGLAVKHEKLLPYLAQTMDNSPAPGEANDARLRGIRYGYSFIEKFIQVPFVLPQPNEKSITRLLLAMPGQLQKEETPPPAPEPEPTPDPLEPPVPHPEMDEDKELEAKARAETQEQIEEEFMKFEGDDDNFRAIVLMVSKAFDYNPRRVKQFVNTFRLRAATANVTGAYEPKDGKRLTFEQLGKFVGIGLRWPLFMRAVERDPAIFSQVVDFAEERPEAQANDKIKQWRQETKLTQLIKAGCSDEDAEKKSEQEKARFSLIGIDIVRLLDVAPSVSAPTDDTL